MKKREKRQEREEGKRGDRAVGMGTREEAVRGRQGLLSASHEGVPTCAPLYSPESTAILVPSL
jgi:hypothetical protein